MSSPERGSASLDPVTTRWAGALFNLARRAGALDQVSSDLEHLAVELESAAVRGLLFGTEAGLEQKRAKLASLSGSFHRLTRNFMALLFDRRREEVLRGVAEAFRRRRLVDAGVIEGHVDSMRPLAAAEVERIAEALGTQLGKRVRLENRIDPELVAGMRVFVGSRMIDYSVQGRMHRMRRKLMEAPLPLAGA